MTNTSLADSYLEKAQARLKTLDVLMAERAYSDVVRESQEIIELALKAMLRQVGVEPPKWHDVGPMLVEHRDRLPEVVAQHVDRLAAISARLRKDRELAFYGDIDFIPTERYAVEDASKARDEARFVVETASGLIAKRKSG